MTDWLEVERGDAPLIVCFPHSGTDIPDALLGRLVSPWLAALGMSLSSLGVVLNARRLAGAGDAA